MKQRQMHWGQGGVGVDVKWGCLMSPNSPPQRVPLKARSPRGRWRGFSPRAHRQGSVALRPGLRGGQRMEAGTWVSWAGGGSRLPPQGLMHSWPAPRGFICPHLAPVSVAVGSPHWEPCDTDRRGAGVYFWSSLRVGETPSCLGPDDPCSAFLI